MECEWTRRRSKLRDEPHSELVLDVGLDPSPALEGNLCEEIWQTIGAPPATPTTEDNP